MNMTSAQYIKRLNELLLKKKDYLLEILTLTQTQNKVITDDGLDRLDQLIKDKQLRIDEINKLDEDFGTYYQRLISTLAISHTNQLEKVMLENSASEGAKQLKDITAEVLDLIRNISEVEKVNSQKSAILLEQFGNEIKKINQGKKANNAYKPGAINAPSYFLDKKK